MLTKAIAGVIMVELCGLITGAAIALFGLILMVFSGLMIAVLSGLT